MSPSGAEGRLRAAYHKRPRSVKLGFLPCAAAHPTAYVIASGPSGITLWGSGLRRPVSENGDILPVAIIGHLGPKALAALASSHEHRAGELGRFASKVKSKAHPSVFLLECRRDFFLVLGFFFFKILFIYFREGEGEKHQCAVASHVPLVGDLACNPGMCPDWELNWRPFGSQASAQSTEPRQPGLHERFC